MLLLGGVFFFGELRSNLVIGNSLDRHLELDHHPAAGWVFDHFASVSTMNAVVMQNALDSCQVAKQH